MSEYSVLDSVSGLRDFELTLKEIYLKNPRRDLPTPHDLEQIRDILNLANSRCPETFVQMLMENRLGEEMFFPKGADVEIYQHLRYLPAYWHYHDFIEIACLTQGSCVNHINGRKINMKAGDICIIAPNTRHAVSAFSDDCLLFNFVLRTSTFESTFFGVFSENDILSEFFMRILYDRDICSYLLFQTGEDSELLRYFDLSLQEFGHDYQYRNLMLRSLVNMFFIVLLRKHAVDVLVPENIFKEGDRHTVLILNYIQDNFEDLTLSRLADHFNYSERQMQRIVKKSTGKSFSQNIQRLKLNEACKLLKNKNLSIGEIADRLGYSTPGNFRYMFKNFFGMTPAEYRTDQL